MIYLDMDGVLADFNRHVRDLGIPRNTQWYEPKDTWTPETLEAEKAKRKAMHTPGFWYRIPLMPDARELWGYCSAYPLYVLTAKPHEDSPPFIAKEKLQYIWDNFGDLPEEHMICCTRSEKQNFVGHSPHKFQILVDDDPRNCRDWENEGGFSVLHVNTKDSIEQIKRIMNKYERVTK